MHTALAHLRDHYGRAVGILADDTIEILAGHHVVYVREDATGVRVSDDGEICDAYGPDDGAELSVEGTHDEAVALCERMFGAWELARVAHAETQRGYAVVAA